MALAIAQGGTSQTTAPGARVALGLGPANSPTFTNLTLTGNLTVSGTATFGSATFTSLTVPDNTFSITGSADATKILRFEVDGFTTGTVRTVTIPNTSTTMVGTDTTQTLTNKTINSSAFNGTLGATTPSTVVGTTASFTSLNLTSALTIANGGTGSTTASGARTALGLVIGTDVQAFDDDLASLSSIAGLGFGTRTATGTWVLRSLTSSANHLTITNPAGTAGNPVLNLAVGALQEGTYTPTITNGTNVTSSSGPSAMFIRIGNRGEVKGSVVVTATGAGATSLGISLPIASNFAVSTDLFGQIVSQAEQGTMVASVANDRADANWSVAAGGAATYFFDFMYTII